MQVIINSSTFNAEYLTNQTDIKNGMMGREYLDGCMLFNVGKGHHSFWMKGCLIPLDIVFVLNGRITKIFLNCPVPDRHIMNPPKYVGLADHVIEFTANTATNWKIGDKVSIY